MTFLTLDLDLTASDGGFAALVWHQFVDAFEILHTEWETDVSHTERCKWLFPLCCLYLQSEQHDTNVAEICVRGILKCK